jgi:hypothetical protein
VIPPEDATQLNSLVASLIRRGSTKQFSCVESVDVIATMTRLFEAQPILVPLNLRTIWRYTN